MWLLWLAICVLSWSTCAGDVETCDASESGSARCKSTKVLKIGICKECGDKRVGVKPSELSNADLGGFARQAFKKGDRVGVYRCEVRRQGTVQQDNDGSYVWKINETHECDGESIHHNNGLRYVNSVASLDTCWKVNVEMRQGKGRNPIAYHATIDIAKGEELLVDYGEEFFKTPRPLAARLRAAGVRYECNLPALHVSSARGRLQTATGLLEDRRVEVDQLSPTALRWTSLMEAAASGHIPLVELLLKHGANVSLTPRYGEGPLWVAIGHGHVDVTKKLLASKANPNEIPERSLSNLHLATHLGHVEIVRMLVQAGSHLEQPQHGRATALFIASQDGPVEIVQTLLNARANPDPVTDAGATPVYVASHQGHVEVLTALVAARADTNVETQGRPPLFVATIQEHSQVVKILAEANARVNKRDSSGSTPLFEAALKGNADIVKILVQARAKVDRTRRVEDNLFSPLYAASMKGHTAVAETLIGARAAVDSSQGPTSSLNAALENGHEKLMDVLIAETGVPEWLKKYQGDDAVKFGFSKGDDTN